MDAPSLVSLRDVWKAFSGQLALQGVDLDLRVGRIRGMVGQNGSGKSTLVKILAGYHNPAPGTRGTLLGKDYPFGATKAIQAQGVRFVHQELGLVENLSIVDNLALVNGFVGRGFLSVRREAKYARAVLARLDLDLDVRAPAASLTPIQKSLVAICRALGAGDSTKVLVLDEPTVALPSAEVGRLLGALRRLASEGLAILYISHNLGEVLEIADDVTVLRDGQVVADLPKDQLSLEGLAGLISGTTEIVQFGGQAKMARPSETDQAVLRVTGLTGMILDNVSFDVRAGEIVGVAGLIGSGAEELPYLLGGSAEIVDGQVQITGQVFSKLSPRSALGAGIVLVARDRKAHSAIPALTARENLVLPSVRRVKNMKWRRIRKERVEASNWMARMDVHPRDSERLMSTFSGGNQQKVVMARALRMDPSVLVLDEPVQGVDVAARAAILRQLVDAARERNLAIVMVSSELEELAAICDRTLVLKRGQLVREMHEEDNAPEAILREMAG